MPLEKFSSSFFGKLLHHAFVMLDFIDDAEMVVESLSVVPCFFIQIMI